MRSRASDQGTHRGSRTERQAGSASAAADKSPRANYKAVERLRELASCGGGHYIGVQDADELTTVFTNIGQATKSGSVLVTVSLSPVPAELTTVDGAIGVGNGAQQLVSTSFSFLAP